MTSKPQRRATRAGVRAELAAYDEHISTNITRVLEGYHAKHVAPLKAWAALPWWKRLFTKLPTS